METVVLRRYDGQMLDILSPNAYVHLAENAVLHAAIHHRNQYGITRLDFRGKADIWKPRIT